MTPLRVLIMEDDAVIGTLLAEMLAGMGYDVCGIEATEGDAVAAAFKYKPDLMIVDARLGEGSGIAAVDKILRSDPVGCVFITGDTARVQALRPEATVIQKPFRQADLARAIQRVLKAATTTETERGSNTH